MSKLLRRPGRPGQVRVILAKLSGSDTAIALGITAKADSPILALCRKLIEAGHDPAAPLEANRGNTLALRVKSIGQDAALRVGTGGNGAPIFAAIPDADIAPLVRQSRRAAG